MNRTVEQLSKLNGKVYVYLKDEKIAKQFLQDAEAEGFRFGKIKPTENGTSNIIAVEKGKKLSYVGFVGHMAFQCPSGVEGNFYRIDYKKYVNGNEDFYFSGDKFNKTEFEGKFTDEIVFIGDNCNEARSYYYDKRCEINSKEDEEDIIDAIADKFDISVIY